MSPQSPYGWWLPLNLSTLGPQLDRVFYIVHVFMLVLFVGWAIFFAYCLLRFRERGGRRAAYATDTRHLNTFLEIGVIAFEVVLIVFFSIPLWATAKYKTPSPQEAVEIEVVAEQFAWNIRYPGADGTFGRKDPGLMHSGNPIGLDRSDPAAQDDILTVNELFVPTGKPVLIHLTSKDVIHSFYLPVLRVKQDAIPGQKVAVWFQATDTGDFEIACAQLCGVAHYRMMGDLFIRTPEEFASWLKRKGAELKAAEKQKSAAKAADW